MPRGKLNLHAGKPGAQSSGRQRTAAPADAVSAVKLARGVPELTKITLAARSAGRCQFRGCNKFLYEHALTKEPGNFSEAAHIVAFRREGPRGDDPERPIDINGIENLMLLCAECHHNVDTHPNQYPRDELITHKREHEARISMLAEFGPELRTNVLTLKSRIGERIVEIGNDEVTVALRPRYPASSSFRVIDLTQLGDEAGADYYPLATRRIREQTREMYADGVPFDAVKHLSVFGLAPIPLLVVLGSVLSNTVPTDLFQSHRDKPNRWTWYVDGEPVRYACSLIRRGTASGNVAVLLSLSGTVAEGVLPLNIDATFSLYHFTLQGATPNPGFLRRRDDLEAFRLAYRQLLADIVRENPGLGVIHLFPAVPAPVAIALGFDLLPKAHPALAIYDFDKRVAGFTERTRVNQYE
ncbi:SAVED domain-containing protein [Inquilinus sp. CA228]|uniref:SAVED domain-containing protein n=1 Tax=Inquilinus sp. CA228 TaxID=3455609 RepID=UPI003F8CFDC0